MVIGERLYETMKPLHPSSVRHRRLSKSAALLFAVLSFQGHRINAAEMAVKDSSIVMSGKLVHGDFDQFKMAIEAEYKIGQVVFENCLGGYVDEGIKIGELIRLKKLSTVAKGQVQSSCAYAFLAGARRRFDSGIGAHLILLHATHNEDARKDIASQANAALIPYLQLLSGGKLTPEILDLVKRSTLSSQGVVFVRENWMIVNTEKVAYCDGSQHGNLNGCLRLPHVDAFQVGIVTERSQ